MKNTKKKQSCSCGSGCCDAPLPERDYTEGSINTTAGLVPVAKAETGIKEMLGSFMVRWGMNRDRYSVDSGLYAFGKPKKDSPVLVTANYKKTFDELRNNIIGLNVWILVLDTKGINVWCAAGKGTFGSDELAKRVKASGLAKIVSHRTLVLPQLGAAGTSAQRAKKITGFSVIYGPVRAEDIKEFLKNGMKASEEMRTVRFTLADRLVLIAVELTLGWKFFLGTFIFALIFDILGGRGLGVILSSWLPYILSIISGAVLVPLLLPYIPGASFAWKGWLMGLITATLYVISVPLGIFNMVSLLFILPPISSYLALNFTGATTFTSLSGVMKETTYGVPVMIGLTVLGIVFKVIGLVTNG